MIDDASAIEIARRLRIATRSVEVIDLCDWVLAMAARGVTTKPANVTLPPVANVTNVTGDGAPRRGGRPQIGEKPMTAAERMKAYRARRKPA